MKIKTAIASLFMLASVQACSQGIFTAKRYSFPIPEEAPPAVTMQTQAEAQAEERRRMLGDPYRGGSTLTVDLTALPDDAWCYPLPRARVISPYKNRRATHHHTGIDLKTHARDSIRAAFDGIVTMSKPFAAYGNCVIIRHASGLETLYSHNSKNLVCEGQTVRAGQAIALTGRTGRATTEHLHFELRVAGQHYNPQLIFNHDTRELKRCVLQFKKGGGVKVL